MLDYNKIQRDFGSPLNTVPGPRHPFKFNLVNVLLISGAVFLVYQGAIKTFDDILKRMVKKKDTENPHDKKAT